MTEIFVGRWRKIKDRLPEPSAVQEADQFADLWGEAVWRRTVDRPDQAPARGGPNIDKTRTWNIE